MKKVILLSLIICSIINLNRIFSGDRLILVERYTSSTCVPCAQNNPVMDAFLSGQDPDKVTSIAYHMNWPAPGNDPMYLYNPNDNNGRRTYYGVNAIPQAFMDGLISVNSPYTQSFLQSSFNTRTAILSPVTIIVTDSTFGDSILVRARILCETALSNPNVTVHFSMNEMLIHYNSPPGTNGEMNFTDVMRKMANGGSGIPMTMIPGQIYIVEQKFYNDPMWQQQQVKPLVFVQQSDKEILNAGTTTSNFTMLPVTGYKVVLQGQSQSADYQLQVPFVAPGYNSPVTFTAAIEPPVSGVNVTFPNGNVLSNFPGSVNVHVTSTSGVPAAAYRIIITGTNTNGKAHSTSVGYLVGENYLLIGSNRQSNNLLFKVDNINYTTLQFFNWTLNSNHSLTAVSPQTMGSYRYIFRNWSDGGDTSHNVTITPQSGTFTVNYGIQYKLITSSQPSNIPAVISAGNLFYDSAYTVNLSVTPQLQYNNQTWFFQRWQGNGNGSYTGPNPGVQIHMNNVIVESAVWDTVAPIGIININTGVPKAFALHQNYPNPFNPSTRIKFDIPKTGYVSIKLYDIVGNEVAVITDGIQNAGYFEAEFNASNYASGVYFYKMESESFSDVKRMILIK